MEKQRSKTVYLMRHGDTGLTGRYIGVSDVPINDMGREQVAKTALILRDKAIDRVYSSPLLRCRQTCAILNLELQHSSLDDLREVDFGRWEGKDFRVISAEDPGLVETWISNPGSFTFPGGESLVAFGKRINDCMRRIIQEGGENILLVSHGGVIRHLICLLLGIGTEHSLVFNIMPGTFSTLELYSQGAVLNGFNLGGR